MIHLFCGYILRLKLTQNFLRVFFVFYHSVSAHEKTGTVVGSGKGVLLLFEIRM